MKAGDVVGEAAVKEGKRGKIDVTVESDVKATVELMERQKFRMIRRITILRLKATHRTCQKGEKAGRMVVYWGRQRSSSADVYAAEDMEKTAVGGLLPKAVIIAALIAVLAGALFILRKIWRRKTCWMRDSGFEKKKNIIKDTTEKVERCDKWNILGKNRVHLEQAGV